MNEQEAYRAKYQLLQATKRSIEGARLLQRRIEEAVDKAPTSTTLSGLPVKNLVGVQNNDLDYYVFELARLQDIAQETVELFGDPEVETALAEFNTQIPHLREIRNALAHDHASNRLEGMAWFDSIVRLEPDGSVTYMVDPRYSHHDAAEALAGVLNEYLSESASQ